MGNCIQNSSQTIALTKSHQDNKFNVCREGDNSVVRVKVLVTRKELEKLMKHCTNNNMSKTGSVEFILDGQMFKDRIGDWKPNLESIPEESSVANLQ